MQLGWGERAPHANGEEWDVRWNSPSLNYTLQFPLGAGGPGAAAGGECVAIVLIDTVPFMDTYRSTSDPGAGPTRPPSRNLPELNGEPFFYEQLEVQVPGDQLVWLQRELVNASNTCNAVLVVGHHGVYTSGTHGRNAKQQDLKERLAFPSVFTWLGVDAYLNGHDHILEHAVKNGTDFITTGAGSDVRTNNVQIPESQYLQADNGFTIHSFNATHLSHIFTDGSGLVTHSVLRPLNAKLRSGGTGAPPPTVEWFAAAAGGRR